MAYTIRCEIPAAEETTSIVNREFHRHISAISGDPEYEAFGVSSRDEADLIIGGLLGCLYYGWLHIEVLWVAEGHRNQGIGTELIANAEAYAQERACVGAYLETSSQDAKRFYERSGYKTFGCLDDYPIGQQKYFLKKQLRNIQP